MKWRTPAQLNVLVPEWTEKVVERIFASIWRIGRFVEELAVGREKSGTKCAWRSVLKNRNNRETSGEK